jgi:hypothetical protein
MKTLFFAAFNGLSILSKVIKFHTRSEISHIAPVDGERLIEPWNHNGGIKTWWDYSGFQKHTPGTKYDIWGLNVSDEKFDFCMKFYRGLADKKAPYDWPGVFAFGLRIVREGKDCFFCSEGAIKPVVMVEGWEHIMPNRVSPSIFCYLVEAAGGRVVGRGVC